MSGMNADAGAQSTYHNMAVWSDMAYPLFPGLNEFISDNSSESSGIRLNESLKRDM